MNSGNTVFAQLMAFLPPYEFQQCVERYQDEYKVKTFSCWDQYLCMAFARLHRIHESGTFFVIRAKSNFRCRRLYSQKVDTSTGIHCDQIVVLENFYAKKAYSFQLRRIRYYDTENNKRFVFLTNNVTLPARTIADLYRCRWHGEFFFRWIKQHLRIKAFYGTTENAVKTPVWIAISVSFLVAIVKKLLKLDQSLSTILQILSVTLFEKTPIIRAFSRMEYENRKSGVTNQLSLFDEKLGQ